MSFRARQIILGSNVYNFFQIILPSDEETTLSTVFSDAQTLSSLFLLAKFKQQYILLMKILIFYRNIFTLRFTLIDNFTQVYRGNILERVLMARNSNLPGYFMTSEFWCKTLTMNYFNWLFHQNNLSNICC